MPRRPRPDRGQLREDRAHGLIPGVGNRDARAVASARTAALKAALAASAQADAARGLCEYCLLQLWRAQRLTGLETFAEEVLELDKAKARELAEAGAAQLALPLAPLPDRLVALWLGTEAALLNVCPEGQVQVLPEGEEASLSLRLPVGDSKRAVEALERIARRASALLRR